MLACRWLCRGPGVELAPTNKASCLLPPWKPSRFGPPSGRLRSASFGWFLLRSHLLYVLAVAIGNCRYVWFDELFTFDIARSTSRKQLWYRELKFDCNPPSVYLLSRVSMAILGPSPLGLRFPSMVEFYCGSVAILLLQQAGFPSQRASSHMPPLSAGIASSHRWAVRRNGCLRNSI
jgi:hypothetical protein